ncbi:hypothetical protein Snoj_20160 [Streptomyces nojiriensis]|uniref:Uncharacterized protein n=1 Tax=Streptomyces nojiriensis TaxID=66374 RepID=A0ABQ3SIX7_9ACTN|nr:hypothetical protein GCM10010205_56940 [Streptomyces nojiriensis]GHI68098.1 hypothetical protein Snoj_20160 [Streptomyces nojiriensis]
MYVLVTCGLPGIGTAVERAGPFATDPHTWRIPHLRPAGSGGDAAPTSGTPPLGPEPRPAPARDGPAGPLSRLGLVRSIMFGARW